MLLTELKKFEDEIVALNKEQLSQGESNEGNIFGYYKRVTQDYANSQNPRKAKDAGSPYNFEWTGGLFDGMFLLQKPNSVEVWSKDRKTPFLNIEYRDMFGLTPENLRKIIQENVLPTFLKQIRIKIGL